MHVRTPSAPSLEALSAADRLARAASLWLRREEGEGLALPRLGPERRDYLAGLVAGLGQWLRQDESVQLLAAYSLAMLEQERERALDTTLRVGQAEPVATAYARGLRVADRLIAEMGRSPAT